MHHASLTFYYFTETMLNWCHNWRRNCKSTHRTMSIHLLLTERLSGTSVSTGSQSSYLHLKVFPSVSLHKLLAYSNSMKGKWKMKKYALNIWQRVIKEGQFWELLLWHFLLAFQKAFFLSGKYPLLVSGHFVSNHLVNQKEKEICSSEFKWMYKTEQYRREIIFHYTVLLEKKQAQNQKENHTQKNHNQKTVVDV